MSSYAAILAAAEPHLQLYGGRLTQLAADRAEELAAALQQQLDAAIPAFLALNLDNGGTAAPESYVPAICGHAQGFGEVTLAIAALRAGQWNEGYKVLLVRLKPVRELIDRLLPVEIVP